MKSNSILKWNLQFVRWMSTEDSPFWKYLPPTSQKLFKILSWYCMHESQDYFHLPLFCGMLWEVVQGWNTNSTGYAHQYTFISQKFKQNLKLVNIHTIANLLDPKVESFAIWGIFSFNLGSTAVLGNKWKIQVPKKSFMLFVQNIWPLQVQ